MKYLLHCLTLLVTLFEAQVDLDCAIRGSVFASIHRDTTDRNVNGASLARQ